MQVDLNGLIHIVNVRWCDRSNRLLAEIVDEAFALPILRAPVLTIHDLASMIRAYSGIAPDALVLSDLAAEYGELFQDAELLQAGAAGQAPLSAVAS